MTLEPSSRVDRLERVVDHVQEQINGLHSTSMQLVTTAFAEMERRLGEKIDKQTRDLKVELNDLRAAMVPMNEHTALMTRVDILYTNDLEGRKEWDRIVPQMRTLWEERSQIKGAITFWRSIVILLSALLTIGSLFILIHNSGISVNVK